MDNVQNYVVNHGFMPIIVKAIYRGIFKIFKDNNTLGIPPGSR